jgi:RimJ/RimL family protein N-acetyltransferase
MTPKLTTQRLILRGIKGNDLFGYYEILSNKATMKLFGGPVLENDLDNKDFVQRMKEEREAGICYFWTITLKEEKEFIGFVRLMSYNSGYYNASFSAMGVYMFDKEFLKYFDRANGWEIDYALLENYRNKGVMREALGSILDYCKLENISPVYAKVNSMTNIATVKVLKYFGFKDHMPQINNKLLEQHDAKTLIDKNLFGMVFKWTV